MSWSKFCELLCERFPCPGAEESMELCQQLKQTTSVKHYIDQFEDWMTLMKHDHPYMRESFFLLRFISGLKDTIKHDTQCHQPATLRNAYWFARKHELSYMCNNKKPTASAKPVTTFPANRNSVARDNRAKPLQDKPRERGKCWYWPENWHYAWSQMQ
jgi:hypothetical protein